MPFYALTDTVVPSTPKQTATVKGVPITQSQIDVAAALLTAGRQANAPSNAMLAIIIAGIYENSLSLGTYSYDPIRQGPLSPPVGSFPGSGLTQATQQAEAFFSGGPHFNSAIKVASNYPSTVEGIVALAEYAEGSEGQYQTESFPLVKAVREARIIASQYGGVALSSGGVANQGASTGTSINDSQPSGFQLGTAMAPDQDMWTTINQLAQERQWYLFSDGETVYLADGPDLLQQDPVMTLDRWGDSDKIVGLSFTWDNTAFQYTVNRNKTVKRVVRKTALQKVQSPVSCSLQVICDIDKIRGGDVIYLTSCGPGNGKWVVGDASRSVFKIYTDCTLVPPMAPLTELQAAGTGNQISNPSQLTSGAVMAAMIQEANSISGSDIPYVWGGGHQQIGVPSIGVPGDGNTFTKKGFDCSGSVSAVLGAGGLLKSPASTETLINQINDAWPGAAVRGRGRGNKFLTIWIDPSTHVFIEINPGKDGTGPQYWGTWIGGADSGSGSGRENSASNGPTWWKAGTPAPLTSSYTPYHIPLSVLGTPLNQPGKNQKATSPQYVIYKALSTDLSQIPAAPYAAAGALGTIFSAVVAKWPSLNNMDSNTAFNQAISITTSPTTYTAVCLDVYNGQAQPSDAANWVKQASIASGDGIQAQPIIYAHISQMPEVKSYLAPLGQQAYRLWVRDLTGSPHIPTGFNYGACEWTANSTYTTSQVGPGFFVKPGHGGTT